MQVSADCHVKKKTVNDPPVDRAAPGWNAVAVNADCPAHLQLRAAEPTASSILFFS